MSRWKLKGCPRCSGDILVLKDEVGPYENCLQCGYEHYLPEEKPVKPQVNEPAIDDSTSQDAESPNLPSREMPYVGEETDTRIRTRPVVIISGSSLQNLKRDLH